MRLLMLLGLLTGIAGGQEVPGLVSAVPSGYKIVSPVTQPTLTPGQVELAELEAKFQDAVAAGGGKAFTSWFADDGVALNNGKPAVLGRGAISIQADWNPRQYQLTWVMQGAQMGPSNDMGFTWGHYEGRAKDNQGKDIVTSGRYMTIWKKVAGVGWKVALDASAVDSGDGGNCCALP